jgi:hypothetical protein
MSVTYEETPYISDVNMDVEIEEREEQLYEDDGKTPVTKTQPDGTVAAGKKTRVKLKRFYYRIVVTVTYTGLVVGDGLSKIGNSIGELKGQGTFNIHGDSGVKYLCGNERAQLVRAETNTWRLTQTWNGFGPWKKVPKNWNLDQVSEEIDEGQESGGGGSGT